MENFLRIWREVDLKNIANNLFVIGELSGECFLCHNLGIKIGEKKCPHCGAFFNYIGFRRPINQSTLKRMKDKYPNATIIDFNDFKKITSKKQARRLLDI
jgi:hypothetical protein